MPYYLDDTIEPSEIYYNILIKNNITGFDKDGNPIPIASSVPLVFDETRSIPYVYHPSKYYMSVLSFEMDTQSIPTFIVEPIPQAIDIHKTIYYVTITDANDVPIVNGHQNIIWVPEDLSAPIPPSPVPDNFNEYPYYFGYTYSYFIELVNKAMAVACSGHTPVINHPPVLQLNNGIVSLVASAQSALQRSFLTNELGQCVDVNGAPNPAGHKLFFNSELYYYFSSLKAIERNEPLNGVQLNANFQLILNINPSGTNYKQVRTDLTDVTAPFAHYDAVVSTCEYPPIPFWNPVDSIVFTTNHLNVVPELIAENAVTGVAATSAAASNAEAYYILTDYAAPLYTGTEYKPNIFFQPQAEYRLSDLYGDNPVYQLVLNVYWKDKYGSLHTFLLESGGTASLKVLFRKKVFYLDF